MPSAVADMFRRAAEMIRRDPRRKGNVIQLPGPCDVVVSGDLHGNRAALDKIIRCAALARTKQTHLVLQEVIHGPHEDNGRDRSIDVLIRAVRLAVEHPGQVLFLMGNHDLSQATGGEIMKNGASACRDFAAGVRFAFGPDAEEVLHAAYELLLSLPLAVRCPNKVWLSHSLPPPGCLVPEVMDVLGRPHVPEDLRRGGAVYEWTWGRGHSAEQVESLAGELDVDFFILGHLHTDEGLEVISPRCVAITSDSPAGCIIRLPCDRPLTAGALAQYVKLIATLA